MAETQKQTQPEKIKVLVNLDAEALTMADVVISERVDESRSSYLRKLIRADYRRWLRKTQKLQAQS